MVLYPLHLFKIILLNPRSLLWAPWEQSLHHSPLYPDFLAQDWAIICNHTCFLINNNYLCLLDHLSSIYQFRKGRIVFILFLIYIYTHTHTYTHTYIYTHIYIHTHIYTYIHTYTSLCMYTHTHTHIYSISLELLFYFSRITTGFMEES